MKRLPRLHKGATIEEGQLLGKYLEAKFQEISNINQKKTTLVRKNVDYTSLNGKTMIKFKVEISS